MYPNCKIKSTNQHFVVKLKKIDLNGSTFFIRVKSTRDLNYLSSVLLFILGILS